MSKNGLGLCHICEVTKVTWDICVECGKNVCEKCSVCFFEPNGIISQNVICTKCNNGVSYYVIDTPSKG
jgi:hypothetical protein